MNKRPLGITAIAIFFVVLSVISFVWSLVIFGVGGISSLLSGLFGIENMAAFATSNTWSGFFGIVASILQFVAAIGLLLLKRWAWYLAVLVVGVSVFQGVVGLFGGGLFSLLCGALLLILPLAVLLYLLSGRIRELFRVN
ncbi:MAG: hypothetical protein R3293_21665 [Candidatus Promineifilaceae bacterium]|nr:hypothetical protein [Candidatus Promineifilaceae bacterium]